MEPRRTSHRSVGTLPRPNLLPLLDAMSTPTSVQKTTMSVRPSSSQRVSVSWDEPENSVSHRAARLQFEVAECVETKTVTTTTTTKRSYPPFFVKEPRSLQSLDTKEYPLAARPTPPELSNFTVDLGDLDIEPSWFDSSFEDEQSIEEVSFSRHKWTISTPANSDM